MSSAEQMRGYIVPIGGAEERDRDPKILSRFVGLCGGSDALIAIIPTADRQRATVKVRVGFDELDPRILPDMGVKVAFQEIRDRSAGTGGVVVPTQAIHRHGDRDAVWVVADGVVERRAVAVEVSSDGESLVSAGLTAGEEVVIQAPADLSAGDRVEEVQE